MRWDDACAEAGLPDDFHFHDTRHLGNLLAAATGASTRELMHRLGHSSMRAALIYQHATAKRDREIAKEMDRRLKMTIDEDDEDHDEDPDLGDDDGSAGALVPAR